VTGFALLFTVAPPDRIHCSIVSRVGSVVRTCRWSCSPSPPSNVINSTRQGQCSLPSPDTPPHRRKKNIAIGNKPLLWQIDQNASCTGSGKAKDLPCILCQSPSLRLAPTAHAICGQVSRTASAPVARKSANLILRAENATYRVVTISSSSCDRKPSPFLRSRLAAQQGLSLVPVRKRGKRGRLAVSDVFLVARLPSR